MAGNIIRLVFAGDSTDAERAMGRVGDAAGQMERTFSAKSLALGAAGAAAGVGLVDAFTRSLEFEGAQAKMAAQLGAGSQMAADAGEIAGNLYADAYGQSLGEVNEAVRGVIQSGAVMEDASNEQIQGITANVMSLAQAFDQDVVGATNAAAQMIRTGLAPDAETALDILTRGFQQGADKAGDLLDTFNEYGTQLRKLGLDGQTAMGLITQGLQAGARDADIVADAVKEFSIRAIDGSKLTAEGFTAIGLSADDMAAKIAAGGPEATAALDLTLDRLRGMKDPTDQAAAATALFGTQAEDLGAALFALDPSTAAAGLGDFAGSAQRVNDTLSDTAENKITAVKRGFDEWLMSIVGVQGPLGDVAAGVVAMGSDAVGIAGNVGMAAIALRGLGIASGIATAAQWLWNAALSANPIGIVVLAIAGLVAGLVWFFTQTEAGQAIVEAAWQGMQTGITGAIDGIMAAVDWIANIPTMVGGWFGEMKDAAIGKALELVVWVAGLPGRFLSAVGNLGTLLVNAGRDVLTGLWNGITGAASWLRGKIASFFGGLLPQWARDFLGIGSPSKVFADQVGQWIPEGVATGIEDNLSPVTAATRDMAATALGGMQPATTGAGSPAAGGGGGGVDVRFSGNTDSAFASFFMRLVRTGQVQINVR